MEEGVFGLAVRADDDERKVRLAEDCGAEHFVATLHSRPGQGDDVVFNHVEETGSQLMVWI